MNETVVDILIYLYENYLGHEEDVPQTQEELNDELRLAGFHDDEIDKAFEWMDGLVLRQEDVDFIPPSDISLRIYSEDEVVRLDEECRGLLIFFEQNGILTAATRELVIDRLMALEKPDIVAEDVKWVVLLVLINQPGQEYAFAMIEDMVYREEPVYWN